MAQRSDTCPPRLLGLRRTGLRLGTNLGAVFAPNYARDYARGGGDYAEPQVEPFVLSSAPTYRPRANA
jgi:hypothetical protein